MSDRNDATDQTDPFDPNTYLDGAASLIDALADDCPAWWSDTPVSWADLMAIRYMITEAQLMIAKAKR